MRVHRCVPHHGEGLKSDQIRNNTQQRLEQGGSAPVDQAQKRRSFPLATGLTWFEEPNPCSTPPHLLEPPILHFFPDLQHIMRSTGPILGQPRKKNQNKQTVASFSPKANCTEPEQAGSTSCLQTLYVALMHVHRAEGRACRCRVTSRRAPRR